MYRIREDFGKKTAEEIREGSVVKRAEDDSLYKFIGVAKNTSSCECQNTTHPRVCGLQYPPKVDISNQHNPQGWAYRWHCGSSTFRPDAISAPTTVPGNPSGSPRLRDT